MTDEEYREKALIALFDEETSDRKYFQKILEKTDYSYDTAINPLKFKDIGSKCYVVLSEKVFLELMKNKEITHNTNMEVPFYMFGTESEDGGLYFTQIISDRENIQEHEAYYKYLNEDFAKYVYDYFSKEIPEENLFLNHDFERLTICCGHTHGSSFGADNFSLCDLDLAVNFKYCAPYVRSQYVKVIDMVINQSGDFNCIKYENNELFKGFYKYPNIYVKANSGKLYKLPAYELGRYGFHEEFRKKR